MVFGAPVIITTENLSRYEKEMSSPRYNIFFDERDDAGTRLMGILKNNNVVLDNIDSWQVFFIIDLLLSYGDNISNILSHLRLHGIDDDTKKVTWRLTTLSEKVQ